MKSQKPRNRSDEDEEKELVPENISIHQSSAPTVGRFHAWVQQGPHMICQSCESSHGFYIGVKKRFKGFDENHNVILEKV